MSKKIRFLNSHKEWLKDNLIHNFEKQFFMTHEAAVAAVTGTSTPAYVDIGRRIVRNCPEYETTHTFVVEDVRRAIGEWLAYKAGVRIDGPVTVDPHSIQQETTKVIDPCVSEPTAEEQTEDVEEDETAETNGATIEEKTEPVESTDETASEAVGGFTPRKEVSEVSKAAFDSEDGETEQNTPICNDAAHAQTTSGNEFDDIVPF